MKSNPIVRLLLASVCLAGISASAAGLQQNVNISVQDGRPLAAAIKKLQDRLGVIITYEDPPYLHPDDWEDVAPTVRRDGRKDPVLVPRSRSFAFAYPLRSEHPNDHDVALMLDLLVAQAARSDPPMKFRVERRVGDYRSNEPNAYHVLPLRVRTKSGQEEDHVPLLNTPISFAFEGDGVAVLPRFAEAVSKASGRKLAMGIAPMNVLGRTHVRVSAVKEPARDVLWRVLKTVPARLSWVVFCSPGEQASCFLSILPVQDH